MKNGKMPHGQTP